MQLWSSCYLGPLLLQIGLETEFELFINHFESEIKKTAFSICKGCVSIYFIMSLLTNQKTHVAKQSRFAV